MVKDKKAKNDIVLIIVLLLIAAAGLFLFNALKTVGDTVAVYIDGELSAVYSLSVDTEVVISTDSGANTLVIKEGRAYIINADCPDGICEAHRPVKNVGETIVCLPHALVIKIESQKLGNNLDIAV